MVRFVRPIVNQILKSQKKRISNYVTQEYGGIAGGIAGIAISAGTGDYYGAVRDIWDRYHGGKANQKNPPIGYYRENGLNGPSYDKKQQALYSKKFVNRFSKRYRQHNPRKKQHRCRPVCCCGN